MDPDSLSAPLVKSVGACVFFILLSNCDIFFSFKKLVSLLLIPLVLLIWCMHELNANAKILIMS